MAEQDTSTILGIYKGSTSHSLPHLVPPLPAIEMQKLNTYQSSNKLSLSKSSKFKGKYLTQVLKSIGTPIRKASIKESKTDAEYLSPQYNHFRKKPRIFDSILKKKKRTLQSSLGG